MVNISKVEECISKWETIVCSISSSKRNGKVTNRTTRVKKEGYEKCIRSFCDFHKEKLTNYTLGKLVIRYVENDKQGEYPYIMVLEHIPNTLIFGEYKKFEPKHVDGSIMYELIDDKS